jgi:hypothetical protein
MHRDTTQRLWVSRRKGICSVSIDAVLSPHTWSHGVMYRNQGRLGVREIWVCDIFQTIMRNGRVGGREGGRWVDFRTMDRKSYLCSPRNETARPRYQLLHTCIYDYE